MKDVKNGPVNDMVKSIRLIRDEVNEEIMDMSYSAERIYLDNLLGKSHEQSVEFPIQDKA